MFSNRSSVDLSPNPLWVALTRARATSRPILDLTEANPTRAGIAYDTEAILGSLASAQSMAYEPAPFGLPSAREHIARELSVNGRSIGPERVVLTASTSEAYAFLFKLLADPGDEVLVPVPSYPLFEHLERLECVRSVPYRLAYDGSWHIDIPSLRAAVSPRTRAVVVVTPHNPTGAYLKRGELDALSSLGVPIVSDEVFAGYPLRDDRDGSRVVSALDAQGAPLVFSLGGLSKLAGLPQMKLAWIAAGGDAAHVARALARLEVIADTFLSVGTPVQHAVGALLASRASAEGAIRLRIGKNLAHLRAALVESSASALDVEGGWYATIRLPRTRSEDEWVLTFLETDSVHVHPGHFFDFEQEAYVVVSLLTLPAVFEEGVRRIALRLANDSDTEQRA